MRELKKSELKHVYGAGSDGCKDGGRDNKHGSKGGSKRSQHASKRTKSKSKHS